MQHFDITKAPPQLNQLTQIREQLEKKMQRKKRLGGAVLFLVALMGFAVGIFLIMGNDSVVAGVVATFFGTFAAIAILVSLVLISKRAEVIRKEIESLNPAAHNLIEQVVVWCRRYPELHHYYQAVRSQGRALTQGEYNLMRDWAQGVIPLRLAA